MIDFVWNFFFLGFFALFLLGLGFGFCFFFVFVGVFFFVVVFLFFFLFLVSKSGFFWAEKEKKHKTVFKKIKEGGNKPTTHSGVGRGREAEEKQNPNTKKGKGKGKRETAPRGTGGTKLAKYHGGAGEVPGQGVQAGQVGLQGRSQQPWHGGGKWVVLAHPWLVSKRYHGIPTGTALLLLQRTELVQSHVPEIHLAGTASSTMSCKWLKGCTGGGHRKRRRRAGRCIAGQDGLHLLTVLKGKGPSHCS